MGMPPSQPCGVFHGRTESFSGSLVSQPLTPTSIPPSKRNRTHFTARHFISGGRMCRSDIITFNYFTEFPAGHDIGNAAVFLKATDDDFGNQFAFPAD